MNDQRATIIELLRTSVLIHPTLKDELARALDDFSPRKLQLLQTILTEAQAKESDVLLALMKRKPALADGIHQLINQAIRTSQQEAEATEQTETESVLSALEDELTEIYQDQSPDA